MRLKLSVIGVEVEPSARKGFASTIHDVLERIRDRVRSVEVRARDVNGDRGGVDKLCTLRLVREDGGTVYAHALATQIDDACRVAAARALAQIVERGRRDLRRARTRTWTARADLERRHA